VKKDIAYNEHGTLLDIYYPKNVDPPMPVIMWIHGGGFIGASKEHPQGLNGVFCISPVLNTGAAVSTCGER
jgi:carboxylesterase type B